MKINTYKHMISTTVKSQTREVGTVIIILLYLVLAQGQDHRKQYMSIIVGQCYLTHTVTFPVKGNRSTRRKLTTFGRALTYALHLGTGFKSH